MQHEETHEDIEETTSAVHHESNTLQISSFYVEFPAINVQSDRKNDKFFNLFCDEECSEACLQTA